MIKVNHYQKAAPEYIHEKKQHTAKKMDRKIPAINKSIMRHAKKEGYAF